MSTAHRDTQNAGTAMHTQPHAQGCRHTQTTLLHTPQKRAQRFAWACTRAHRNNTHRDTYTQIHTDCSQLWGHTLCNTHHLSSLPPLLYLFCFCLSTQSGRDNLIPTALRKRRRSDFCLKVPNRQETMHGPCLASRDQGLLRGRGLGTPRLGESGGGSGHCCLRPSSQAMWFDGRADLPAGSRTWQSQASLHSDWWWLSPASSICVPVSPQESNYRKAKLWVECGFCGGDSRKPAVKWLSLAARGLGGWADLMVRRLQLGARCGFSGSLSPLLPQSSISGPPQTWAGRSVMFCDSAWTSTIGAAAFCGPSS